jgi:hypothetical protein
MAICLRLKKSIPSSKSEKIRESTNSIALRANL